ncbi:DUF2815 family protein [Porcincola sp. LCP21S3_C12]|jgi:hypothetical protein|uniref:DUF2815 family protein n=1 Tax=Porcincola sp. LCP21S3_C12 TaxID=3438798 RepID=UPI003F9517C4
MNNPLKVITGKNTRFSYLNVNEPKSINGSTPKYSASLIISKSDTITIQKIKAAIKAAYEEGEAKLKGNGKSVPPLENIKTPLRDGDMDRPDDPAYANSYFLNANSTRKPGVVDANNNIILDTSELYSGIYGRASINFYAYNRNGNRGIACSLNALQKLRDGDPLGGHVNAETEFAGLDDDNKVDFLN